MRGAIRRTFVCLTLALALFGMGAGAATAQMAIGPNQHFIGLVNGSNNDPVVYTVCPGPTGPGRTGPVASGQTLSVAEVAKGAGYTGPFSQIYAWFVPAPTSPPPVAAPIQLKFTTYGISKRIPTSVRVPCGGAGQVEFSSCPYLAPCAYGWVPDIVNVRFVDIAV
jgi:hypothetical protein